MAKPVLAWLMLALVWPAAAEPLRWYRVPAEASSASVETVSPEPQSVAPPPRRGALPYAELIAEAAAGHGLDPLLLHAVVSVESGYRADALSAKGARGLMQLMPATGLRFGKTELWAPRYNLQAGAAYLSWLLDHFGGRLELALAGYNAGEGAVRRHGGVIPPYAETRVYVDKVLDRYQRLGGRPTAHPSTPTFRPATDFDHLVRLLTGGPRRAKEHR
ncbi:lytic transglycosylase domain-containing protein [Chromobacterium violaceum]|uniref:lytic transglycosylase domain-containing protein n=1 Tax=Chromobacterium violaceum TaxID=536 RepID=UPI001BEC8A41|nr:lytic transglycosylase domain-containing protein [Chromobacterium violaceum]MBT2869670.1 lytic transglycosylase domain-containing protein [Chromobacterium violaceum]